MEQTKREEGQTEKEPQTVEIPEVKQPEAAIPLSLSDLADSGFTKEELAMAEKNGLVKTGEESNEQEKNVSETEESGASDFKEKVVENNPKQKEEQRVTQERRPDGRVLIDGKTPEQIMADVNVDMTPEQEKFLSGVLNANAFGLYRAQKRERQKRQAVDEIVKQRDAEIAELRKQNESLKRVKVEELVDDPLTLDEPKPAAEVDPKKRPLTQEDLERIDSERQQKAEKEEEARLERARDIKVALEEQEGEARARYSDLDPAIDSAADIIKAATENRLEELFPNPKDRSRIKREVTLLLGAYANADQIDPGEFNAADMTYELGKKHPKYSSKPANANSSKRGETDADGDPEKVTRALQNANRRGSSAALNGGGSRRAVNLEELTVEQARRIPTKEFNKLPKETRERLLRSS